MSRKNGETRINILKAAIDLLEADQGSGVRMSDIAKQAKVSRQAVYLHFNTRAQLLIATTQYVDELNGIEKRQLSSSSAQPGIERLDAYVEAWGNYIPEIYAIAKALLAMGDSDEAAAKAWEDRMQAMRQGCETVVNALKKDKTLSADYSPKQATDILWTMLSVRNWEHLIIQCGWPQKRYVNTLKSLARNSLVQ